MSDFKTTVKESLLRLIFELMGTCLLTTLWLSTNPYNVGGGGIGFFIGFFVLLVFSARISGSHFNPAVTLAFMVRTETGGFSRALGFAYILFQLIGALLGGLLGYIFFMARPPLFLVPTVNGGYLILQSMFLQIIAAAILVFLYLTQTEEKTKLSDDNAITTLIIAASYFVSVFWSSEYTNVQTPSPVNPAIAIADSFAIWIEYNIPPWRFYIWMFWVFPLVGSLLAVLLFECVFKRAQKIVADQKAQEDGSSVHESKDDMLLSND